MDKVILLILLSNLLNIFNRSSSEFVGLLIPILQIVICVIGIFIWFKERGK